MEEGFYRAVGHAASPGVLVEVPDKKFNQTLKFAGRNQGKGKDAPREEEVRSGRYCPPRHQLHLEPPFLDFNGIL